MEAIISTFEPDTHVYDYYHGRVLPIEVAVRSRVIRKMEEAAWAAWCEADKVHPSDPGREAIRRGARKAYFELCAAIGAWTRVVRPADIP